MTQPTMSKHWRKCKSLECKIEISYQLSWRWCQRCVEITLIISVLMTWYISWTSPQDLEAFEFGQSKHFARFQPHAESYSAEPTARKPGLDCNESLYRRNWISPSRPTVPAIQRPVPQTRRQPLSRMHKTLNRKHLPHPLPHPTRTPPVWQKNIVLTAGTWVALCDVWWITD